MSKEYITPFFKYQTIASLGNGGAGYVEKVQREGDNKLFAIKVLNKNNDIDKTNRFKNEYAAQLALNHPNIVHPIDSGRYNDQLFYVMPLAASTLRSYIGNRDGVFCNTIALKIINALECLHNAGITHRDLKPENILMMNDEPMICDLGIAHISPEYQVDPVETKKDSRMANFKYAAPEQRSRNPQPAPTMDIYSLGIIIHELFTGEFIQSGKTKSIEEQYPEYGYWDKIIDKCIHNLPEQRFESAIRLKEEFQLLKWDISFPISDDRTEAKHFYYDRFIPTFPERIGFQVFDNKEVILARLSFLLRPPYTMNNHDCIWWTRGTEDNPVNKFWVDTEKGIAYIGDFECDIKEIVAVHSLVDYKCCVYVEVSPMQPLFSIDLNENSQKEEYFTLYQGKVYPESFAENGYYWDGPSFIKTQSSLTAYRRFLKPYNFLLLSKMNPLIQTASREDVANLLNDILDGRKQINDLISFLQSLRRPLFYRNPRKQS